MAEESDLKTGADATGSSESGYAGVVEVQQLVISNHLGQNVNVQAIYTEIETTTSVFEPGISGSVLLYDAQGLINRLPIVGEEKLYLTYATPGNEPKKGEFRIWKVTDEQPDVKGNSSVYRLHFCGEHMFYNAKNIIAKSYTNTDDVSAMVKDISTEFLHISKDIESRGVIRDPAKKLVIPMYRPFEAIDMLLRRAYSGTAGKSDYFLFFERFDKWCLRMLESLVEQPVNKRLRVTGTPDTQFPPPVAPGVETWYVYASDKYQDDSVTAKDIRRIVQMRIDSRFDSLQKIREGAYDGEVVTYSIRDKAVTFDTFKYLRDGSVKIGGSDDPYEADAFVISRDLKSPSNTEEFMSTFSNAETGYSGAQATKVYFRLKDPEEKDGVVKKSGNEYQSLRALLSQIRVTITVPGDTMVDAGDIVHLAIPRFDSFATEAQPDKFLYGKYIVGSIRDSILAPDKHAMTLDLFRDGYLTKIADSELHKDV